MKRVLAGVLSAGFFVAGCGQQPPGPGLAGVPAAYQDQTGADWSYTAPEQSVKSLALGDDASSWSLVLSARSGWGPIEINMSNGEKAAGDGRPMQMGGVGYAYGLGLHSRAEIKYRSSQATGLNCAFSADVGIDDEVGDQGSVKFQAFADGKKIYDSGVLRGSDTEAKHVAFVFPSAKSLSVKVTDAGDNNYFDHTDIANPLVSCIPSVASPSLTLDPVP